VILKPWPWQRLQQHPAGGPVVSPAGGPVVSPADGSVLVAQVFVF